MAYINYSDVREDDGHLVRELHGVTLVQILDYLLANYSWAELDDRIRINCFANNPTKKSSLNFLRRTPWAREKVEQLYIDTRARELVRLRRTENQQAADNKPEQTQ
ncbi:VF530 family DNA-binding protein [Solirubrum puertoriconensis]|uniref:Transporter n=1 Tax=Solirubrum puertoriconensis TaxID=1751427 RepID=A0A9X0L4I7_SOLP1|nr:VF530 family protein [Solirubrum puertoriconensis]KUG07630.1 hypothetical protein ASU33_14970 [Solirubrum puertoriconensis]